MGIINKRTFSRFSSFDIKCVCSRSIATLRLDNCMPFQLISAAAAAAVVCPPNTYMIVFGVQRSAQPRTKKNGSNFFAFLIIRCRSVFALSAKGGGNEEANYIRDRACMHTSSTQGREKGMYSAW